jgi:parallel beta-helix repeat protein
MIYVSGGVSGVHIKNLSLDGYKTGQTAGVGINFDGIYDSSIENILTLNIYENAITLNNVFRVTVKNCRFTYSGDNDVYVTGSAEVKILDNSMESAGISGIYAYNNARGILAQGNDILDSGKWGIDYYLTPESEIIGNHIRNIADGTDRDGIAIKYSYYVTVSGNTCEHNGDTGIALLDTKFDTVTGNTITLAYFNGIYGMAAQYNTISGNILTDNGRYANGTLDGLTLEDTGGFSSSYNTITGNVAYDDQTPHIQAWGFRELSGANVNSFVNDNCFNNAVGGILKIGANSNVHLFYNNTFSAWVS